MTLAEENVVLAQANRELHEYELRGNQFELDG
jgi:hypothetical protein